MKHKRPKSPCKDCPDRNAECHSVCERYKQFVIDNQLFKDELNAIRDVQRPTQSWYKDSNGFWKHR